MKINLLLIALAAMILFAAFIFTPTEEEKKVVVYVSHDQDYSEPILREFEELSGIRVDALYDTEATKTVGLVNRLLAEKNRPVADVYWNNEPMRSVLLKKNGVLKPYCSPNAADIPEEFKDKDCYWTGFAARARVIIYNKDEVNESDAPKSIFDLAKAKWKGKVCIAKPTLGSTATHIAALFAALGDDGAKAFLLKLKNNSVQVVESNSMVRDQVTAKECWIGLTDTDDAYDAILAGKPIGMIFPDQEKDGLGDLVFPNTVMLINGAPHESEGKKLIDFLLTVDVEEKLAKSALQIPLKASSPVPAGIPKKIRTMNISFEDAYSWLETSNNFILEEFLV